MTTNRATIVLIDNYDSFTYNLVHYLGELGADVRVIRNDKITVEGVRDLKPDAVVISPGPGTPDKAGICVDLVKDAGPNLPVLGVCLGHQAIGEAFGGQIIRAPVQMHGKLSAISHQGRSVFAGLENGFEATRYHSLVVERASLPDCFEVTADTGDGQIMGLAHKTLPLHGVQFHPESIASAHGHDLLANFLKLV